MTTKITGKYFLLIFAIVGLLILSGSSFAQQKTGEQVTTKKTITIHVTKEVDGKTTVIDTTVVTDGDFDADAFLEEKGIINDMPENGRRVEKNIVVRRPGTQEFGTGEPEADLPDTVFMNDDTLILFSDKFDMPVPPPPHQGMAYENNFDMPGEFPYTEGPNIEAMLEGLARTFGLENVMPFGEMKQVVVKKKRNGKKIIITFEDRKDGNTGNEKGKKNTEKVMIFKNNGQSQAPQNEERIIIEGQPGERVLINKTVDASGDVKTVTVKAGADKSAPVVKEKKVIIIKEEKVK
jgi:hypothetical protein